MQKSSPIVTKNYSGAKRTFFERAHILSAQINIAVIGCGYWGPKLVRNLAKLKEVKIYALCDLEASNATRTASEYAPNAHIETDYHAIFDNPQIHGVFIATPATSHFHIAKEALLAGKHVFVEKPLAMSAKECEELIHLAKETKLILMVGHVFRYNTAVQRVKEYIEQGVLGDIIYILSRRLNLGKIQTDINALWSFAPHDISTILYWLNEEPVKVISKGFSYLNHGIEDIVFMTLEFPSKAKTHSHLSWLNPTKIREMTIIGSKKILVYDDVSLEKKIQIYDKSVIPQEDLSSQLEWSYLEFQANALDQSNSSIPYLPFTEPLKVECQHFIDCICSGTTPLTNGQEGLSVVRVLEAAQKSLKQGGVL